MGLFTPKYPEGAEPPRRESRAARKEHEQTARVRAVMDEAWKNARRASKERSARFWDDYEQQHGPGSGYTVADALRMATRKEN